MSHHPFESIPDAWVKRLFLLSLMLYLVLQAVFAFLDIPLRTPAAPNGAVSFELAGSADAARAMIESWSEPARIDAAFGLGIDFLFMFAYSTVTALAAIWAGRRLGERDWLLGRLGGWVAWGIWLAIVCDAIENVALLSELWTGASAFSAAVAASCATVKFALIVVALFYIFYGLSAWFAGARVRN